MSLSQSKSICFFCSPYGEEVHTQIEKGIIADEYSLNRTYGFRIHQRRKQMLSATYIEKRLYVESVTDPFGSTTEYQRTIYKQIDFQLRLRAPQLIVYHPPTNFRNITNQLAHFTGYNLVVERKTVDLLKWINFLFEMKLPGKVIKLQLEKLVYDIATSGKLFLQSERNILPRLYDLMGKISYYPKKARVRFDEDVNLPDVDIGSNGTISFTRPVETTIFHDFYDGFYSIQKGP